MPERIYEFDCGYCFKISDIHIDDDEVKPRFCPFCGNPVDEAEEDELDFDA